MSMVLTVLELAACAATAGLTTYFLLERREARFYTSAKAEDLYSLLEGVEQELIAYFIRICSADPDARAAAPSADAGWEKLMRDSARARMLVSFYFPALWPQMKRADGAIASAATAMRRYQAGRRDEGDTLGFEQSVLDMRETVETLKHAVVMAHRDQNRRPTARRKLASPAEALRMAA